MLPLPKTDGWSLNVRMSKKNRGFCSFSFSVFVVFFCKRIQPSSFIQLFPQIQSLPRCCHLLMGERQPCPMHAFTATSVTASFGSPESGFSSQQTYHRPLQKPITLSTVLSSGGFDIFYIILCTIRRKRKIFQRSLHSRGHHIVLVHIIVCMCVHHMYPENTDGPELRMPTSFHLSSNPSAV